MCAEAGRVVVFLFLQHTKQLPLTWAAGGYGANSRSAKKRGKTHPQYSNQPQTNGTDGKGEGTNGYGEVEGEKTMTEILDWSN